MTGIFLVAIIAVISVSDLISIDSINWPAELSFRKMPQNNMERAFIVHRDRNISKGRIRGMAHGM